MAYMRQWVAGRKADGRCIAGCDKPAAPGILICAEHQEMRNREQREKRRVSRDLVYQAYGGEICACCGETEPRFLSLDHINNDGNKERREGKRGDGDQYCKLVREGFPPGYQVLCHNCNHGRFLNGNTCPHEIARQKADTDFCMKPDFNHVGDFDISEEALTAFETEYEQKFLATVAAIPPDLLNSHLIRRPRSRTLEPDVYSAEYEHALRAGELVVRYSHKSFQKAITKTPHDDTTRGVYADWLQERDLADDTTLDTLRNHPGPVWVAEDSDGKALAGRHWTMDEIVDHAAKSGSTWFETGNMRFFGTRLSHRVHNGPGGIHFVTSEQPPHGPRGYTVRKFTPFGEREGERNARINTVGDRPAEHATSTTAHAIARQLSRTVPPKSE